jgi:HEAT repeat protein
LLAVVLGLGPGLHAQVEVVRPADLAVSAAGGAGASAAGSTPSLPADLAGLVPELAHNANTTQQLYVLRRVLTQAGLPPSALAGLPAESRPARVEAAVADYVRGLVETPTAPSSDDPVRAVVELDVLQNRNQDALEALSLVRSEDAAALDRELLIHRAAKIHAALIAHGDALAQQVLSTLSSQPGDAENAAGAGAAVWYGRSVVVPVGSDGSVVTLKFERPNKFSKENEGVGLWRARLSGLDAPVPLPSGKGYTRVADAPPRAELGTSYTAYLVPGETAGKFFTYLGDPLPRQWSLSRKAQAVRTAALSAVDDMRRLRENGWRHETLAPLSHSESRWEWDYWRESGMLTPWELPRRGPTAIHNWEEGLSFANIRLSGLADFEHLVPLATADQRKTEGQNVFELIMLVIRAGYRDRLSSGRVAAILAETLRAHAAGFSDGGSVMIARLRQWLLLRGIVQRFYAFYAAADAMPRSWVQKLNAIVSKNSQQALPVGAALSMPGEIVHPLIVDVIEPYVDALIGPRAVQYDPSPSNEGAANYKKGTPFRRALRRAFQPVQALAFGFETAPYLGPLGRFRRPWIWREGDDPDAQVRRKKAAALLGRQDPRALTRLVKALSDPDEVVRRYALNAFKDVPDPGLTLIGRLLGSPHIDVRQAAARALKKSIYFHDPSLLPLVENLLSSPYPDVRSMALAMRDVRDPIPLALLEQVFDDPENVMRQTAADILNRRRRADSETLALIGRLLESPHADVRGAAAMAVADNTYRYDPGLQTIIEKVLSDPVETVRASVANRFGASFNERALIEWASNSPYSDVRRAAFRELSLSNFGSLALAERGLADPSEPVRYSAREILQKHVDDPGAIDVVARLLDSPHEDARRAASAALGGKLLGAQGSAPLVEKVLADPSEPVRGEMRQNLIDYKALEPALLEKALNSPYPDVRNFAFRGLENHGLGSLKLVKRGLADPDEGVRRTTAVILADFLDAPGAVPLVEKVFADPSESVRGNMWYALARVKALEPALLERALSSPYPDVRKVALSELGKRGLGSLTHVERGFGDSDESVRQVAAGLLPGYTADPGFVALVERLLDSPHADARSAAFDGLLNKDLFFPAFVERGLGDPEESVRRDAARLLLSRRADEPGILSLAERALDSRYADVRPKAAELLSRQLHDETVFPALLEKLLSHADEAVRAKAIFNPWYVIKDETGLAEKLAITASPFVDVRLFALRLLGPDADPVSRSLIEASLDDPDPRVRGFAAQLACRLDKPDMLPLVKKVLLSPHEEVQKAASYLVSSYFYSDSVNASVQDPEVRALLDNRRQAWRMPVSKRIPRTP